jgi:hypothetical protein
VPPNTDPAVLRRLTDLVHESTVATGHPR